jgi:hypothetical protein
VNAFKLSVLAIAGFPLLGACGGDNLTLPSEGQPADIQIVEFDPQSGPVNTDLGPLVVKVTDTQGRPVPGATVEFAVTGGGAGGSITPDHVTTGGDGQASATVHLGTQVGTMTGEAHVQVPEGAAPVSVGFSATAVSEGANTIVAFDGLDQSAPVGSELPNPLVARVTDSFGNPIAGIPVEWEAQDGGSVSETSTVTDADGKASVIRTLGPTAGDQHTLARADGLAGSPVSFTHHATAGNPSAVNIVSGNNQEAPAGTKVPLPLVVKLLDQDGNPIPNRPVTWVVGAGGGSVDPATSNTGPDGQASTEWTLGPNPGTNTLNAVVSGLDPAAFRATGTGTGAPSTLAVVTQPPGSVQQGATLNPAPVVQVRDGQGHDVPAPGLEITVALSGPGQLDGTKTVTTDGNGRATFGDLRITGASGSHRLIFAADGLRSVTSSKIEVEKIGTTVTITQDDTPDPSQPGQPVAVGFAVSSAGGAPTGEVEVTAPGSAPCTAAAPQGTCQVSPTESGDITVTYKGDNSFASSSASVPHTVSPPPNNAPTASFTHADCVTGLPCQFTDTSTDPEGNGTIVKWTWNFGDGTAPVTDNQNPAHVFGAPSSIFPYLVILTVEDNQGASNTTTLPVNVQ